jgi:hypothetical protein
MSLPRLVGWVRPLVWRALIGLICSSFAIGMASAGSVALTWQPPTERTDGAALDGLSTYRIYWRCGAGQGYPLSLTIPAPATGHVLDGLPDGETCRFVVTALDLGGLESAFSNEASKALPVVAVADPVVGPLITWSESAPVALAIAQTATQVVVDGGGSATLNISFPGTPTAGNAVVLVAAIWQPNTTWTIDGVGDNQGNTYTRRESFSNSSEFGGRFRVVIAHAADVAASGTFTATITLSGAGDVYAKVGLVEVSGAAASSLEDQFDVNDSQNVSATDVSAGPITTTVADTILFAASSVIANDATLNFASPASFTNLYRANDSANSLAWDSAYRIVSATDTFTPQWGHDNSAGADGAAVVVALIAAEEAADDIEATGALSITGVATLNAPGSLAGSGSVSVAGAADLDGVGSLAALGAVSISGSADLTEPTENDIAAAGALSISGLAALNGPGTLAAAGSVGISGVADLNAVGSLAAAGSLAVVGDANLKALGELGAIGALSVSGTADLDAIGDLLAAGALSISGTADLDAMGALASAGALSITGSAIISGSISDLSAVGSLSIVGAADIDAVGTLAASGSVSVIGAANLTDSDPIDLAADGTLGIAGSAALSAFGSLQATGALSVVGSADLEGDGVLVANGTLFINGGAAIQAPGQLTAAGQIAVFGAAILVDANAGAPIVTTSRSVKVSANRWEHKIAFRNTQLKI